MSSTIERESDVERLDEQRREALSPEYWRTIRPKRTRTRPPQSLDDLGPADRRDAQQRVHVRRAEIDRRKGAAGRRELLEPQDVDGRCPAPASACAGSPSACGIRPLLGLRAASLGLRE